MASSKKRQTTAKKREKKSLQAEPPMRAWHVVMANGADQTVTAHECDSYGGVLSFTTIQRSPNDDDSTYLLVRAFAANTWRDVELVPTPDAVHMPPPADMVNDDARRH